MDGERTGRAGRPPREIETALRELADAVAFPPAPDLTGRVSRAIAADGRGRGAAPAGGTVWSRPAIRWGAVAVVLLLALVLAAVPEARRAIADRLGLGAVTIRLLEQAPTPPPVGESLLLGGRVDLETARQRFGPGLALPSGDGGLGPPDEVYLSADLIDPWVSFVYRDRPGLPETQQPGVGALLSQVRGLPARGMLGKGLGPGTRVEPLTINGEGAFWIEGRPHRLVFPDESGDLGLREDRLAGNVLVWEQDGVTYRLEAEVDRATALAIAASMERLTSDGNRAGTQTPPME